MTLLIWGLIETQPLEGRGSTDTLQGLNLLTMLILGGQLKFNLERILFIYCCTDVPQDNVVSWGVGVN